MDYPTGEDAEVQLIRQNCRLPRGVCLRFFQGSAYRLNEKDGYKVGFARTT